MSKHTATKTKPKLWKRIVASVKAGSKGGRPGQWSARKAQIATARYKKLAVVIKEKNPQVIDLVNGPNKNGDTFQKETRKNQEQKEEDIYLKRLEKYDTSTKSSNQ